MLLAAKSGRGSCPSGGTVWGIFIVGSRSYDALGTQATGREEAQHGHEGGLQELHRGQRADDVPNTSSQR